MFTTQTDRALEEKAETGEPVLNILGSYHQILWGSSYERLIF
jgi:hypothetical protein